MAHLHTVIGRQHFPALLGEDAGKNHRAAGSKMGNQLRRHPDQRPGKNIGDDQIERPVAGKRAVERKPGAVSSGDTGGQCHCGGTFSRATRTATGSISVARTGILRSLRTPIASTPLPVPRSSALRTRRLASTFSIVSRQPRRRAVMARAEALGRHRSRSRYRSAPPCRGHVSRAPRNALPEPASIPPATWQSNRHRE